MSEMYHEITKKKMYQLFVNLNHDSDIECTMKL